MFSAYGDLRSVIGVLLAGLVLADSALANDDKKRDNGLALVDASTRPDYLSSVSFTMDNDALVPASLDGDYTYGFNLAFSGMGVEKHWASAHGPLDWLDRNLGLTRYIGASIESSEIEYGLLGFPHREAAGVHP